MEARNSSVKATGQARNRRQAIPEDGGEWLSAKPKAKRKKATKAADRSKTKKATVKRKKKTQTKEVRKAPAKKPATRAKAKSSSVAEVIDLLSDGGDDDSDPEDVARESFKRAGSIKESAEDALWDDDDDESDEEYEFE